VSSIVLLYIVATAIKRMVRKAVILKELQYKKEVPTLLTTYEGIPIIISSGYSDGNNM